MDAHVFFNELERIVKMVLPVSGDGPIVLVLFAQVFLLLIGLVRLMLPDYRVHGWITVGHSLLYTLSIYLIDNSYMPIVGMVLFAVLAVYLGIMSLTEGHYYDKKDVKVALWVYGICLAILVAVLFFLSKKNVLEFITGITRIQWQYGILLACFGIQYLPWATFALFFLAAGATSGPPPSNMDGVNGATGNEQSVDTTSMS